MTKKELEQRLEVAESIIQEAIYLLSDDNIQVQKEEHENLAHMWVCIQAKYLFNDYESRVRDLIEYGKDFHKPIVKAQEEELSFYDGGGNL